MTKFKYLPTDLDKLENSKYNLNSFNCIVNRTQLTHLCPPLRSTFAVRETASLGIMGAPRVPPLYRETQSLGQHMLELSCENATVGKNGLRALLKPLNTTVL